MPVTWHRMGVSEAAFLKSSGIFDQMCGGERHKDREKQRDRARTLVKLQTHC